MRVTTPADAGIVMYGRARFCPDVTRARTRLTELGLSWTEYDVEADTAARERMTSLTGRGNVPTLIIGESILVEPSTDEIDAALQQARMMPAPA